MFYFMEPILYYRRRIWRYYPTAFISGRGIPLYGEKRLIQQIDAFLASVFIATPNMVPQNNELNNTNIQTTPLTIQMITETRPTMLSPLKINSDQGNAISGKTLLK